MTFYENDLIVVKATKKTEEMYGNFHGGVYKVLCIEPPMFAVQLVYAENQDLIGLTQSFNFEDFYEITTVSKAYVQNLLMHRKQYLENLEKIKRKNKSKYRRRKIKRA